MSAIERTFGGLMKDMRDAGVATYEDQRAVCVKVLEAAGIQCFDHEDLELLLVAVAENINDGTIRYLDFREACLRSA